MGTDKEGNKHKRIPAPLKLPDFGNRPSTSGNGAALSVDTKKRKVVGGIEAGGEDPADRAERLALKAMSRIEKTKDPNKKRELEAKLAKIMTVLGKGTTKAAAAAAASTAQASKKFKPGAGATDGFEFKYSTVPAAGILGKRAVSLLAPGEKAKRQQRAQRFAADEEMCEREEGDEDQLVRQSGVGTCESLEKEYLRLTSLPRASSVRPPNILSLALDLVKARWLEKADYKHACEQLKSIRQDLTVQHVRDKLTVNAYETHGRIALEVGDLAEFRQCHGVLKQLYKEGVPGNRGEFIAYGLLFALTAGQGSMLVSELMATTAQEDLQHPSVEHALGVCRAVKQGDYHSFACLYRTAPRMSPYLMDRILPRMRAWALQAMMIAYRPSPLPLSVLGEELAVDQDGADLVTLLQGAGGRVDLAQGVLDTKASQPTGRGAAG